MMSQKKIVVVDDEDIILDMVKALLTEQGYWVETTKNPGLAAIRALDADLVILDLKLSGKDEADGVRVISRLWENNTAPAPVIIFSGNLNFGRIKDSLENTLKELGIENAVFQCVEKGKGITKLLDAVDSYFQQSLNGEENGVLRGN